MEQKKDLMEKMSSLNPLSIDILITLFLREKIRFNELERVLKDTGRKFSKPTLIEHLKSLVKKQMIIREEEGAQKVTYRINEKKYMITKEIKEEYNIDSGSFLTAPSETDFDPENEKLLLEDLRRKLNLLGDVNLTAEKDYEEEKKRLDFLVKERDDLIKASDKLKETIDGFGDLLGHFGIASYSKTGRSHKGHPGQGLPHGCRQGMVLRLTHR